MKKDFVRVLLYLKLGLLNLYGTKQTKRDLVEAGSGDIL